MPYSSAERLIRHVTLRQLQIFETVVRLQGYTRAAEALHLTQPTVSMQIRKLSEAIGVPLLEMTRQGPRATRTGREVYEAAREILGRMRVLGEETADQQGVVGGPLKIGVITTAKYFMPQLLGAFVNQHPGVEPRLTVTNQRRVIERLRNHDDDLLIMGRAPDSLEVEIHPFMDNELVVVAPPDHPLAHARHISLDQLRRERFLVREPGSGTRQAVERLLAAHEIRITPYLELGSSEAIKQGVMGGLGISVLSRRSLRLELAAGHIVTLNVESFPLIRTWNAVYPRDRHLPCAARVFLDFLMTDGPTILKEGARRCGTPK